MSKIFPTARLKELCSGLILDDNLLKQYMKIFTKELKAGLSGNESAMKCYVTYIHDLPSGKERGNFLAMDFSGIVVKVILISLKKLSFDLRSKQYIIPTAMLSENAETLFRFLAECLLDFTKSNKVNKSGLPMGFAFGFPCNQKSIKSALLREWTKGFNCRGVVGEDVVALMEKAISDIPDLKVKICCLINDSTGILLSTAWKARETKIGVVLDAGTNICYVEKMKNVTKYSGSPSQPLMIINTEYGNMGIDGKIDFLRTGWDKELDETTLNPNRSILEKMIASLYLGEIVRRVLVTAIERNIILKGNVTAQINTVGAFDTTFIVDMAKPGNQSRMARNVLIQLGYSNPWTQDCSDVQYVCEMVWQRAATLAAATVAAIVNHVNAPETSVAFDGAFYRAHAEFAALIDTKLRSLLKPKMQVKAVLAEDGAGFGAALAAAAFCDHAEEGSAGSDEARRRTREGQGGSDQGGAGARSSSRRGEWNSGSRESSRNSGRERRRSQAEENEKEKNKERDRDKDKDRDKSRSRERSTATR